MAWPKKDERYRVYLERKDKSYLLVSVSPRNTDGSYEAAGELLVDNDPHRPQVCTTSVSPNYLYSKCRRVSWDEVPEVWQQTLGCYLDSKPESYRGLWRIKRKEVEA